MVEQLKHECGVAMIRLLKSLDYYETQYGTRAYGFNKLYLMMEKQHNRGQEGAGIGCVNLDAPAGTEYMFREKAEGKDAITEIFKMIGSGLASDDDSANNSQLSILNYYWVICAIRLQARADYNMFIRSCAVTTGAPRTSVCAATST